MLNQKQEELNNINEYVQNLRKHISNELNLDNRENIDLYIKLLIDKIVVSKINDDRKNINLEIYFNFNEIEKVNVELGFSKPNKNKSKKCLFYSYNKGYDTTYNNGTNR